MGPARQTFVRWLLLALAVAAVHVFREPGNYLLPSLAYEDGRDMFAFFYNHREPGAILRFYNGYISLLPNLAGYLAVLLPTPWVPRALALFPLASATVAFSLFSLPSWRPLIKSDAARAGVCLALAMAPVGNRLFIANTTYSNWTLLLTLVWLSLAPPPRRALSAAARFAVMVVLVCSHPLSLSLVPVWLAAAVRSPRRGEVQGGEVRGGEVRREKLTAVSFYGALSLAAVLYQVLGVAGGGLSPPGPAAVAWRTVVFTLERVVFGSLFGDAAARFLRRAGAEALIPIVAVAVLVTLAWLLARRRKQLEAAPKAALGAIAWLILAFTAAYVVGRSPDLGILAGGQAFRYFWLQRVLFLAALAITGYALWGPRLAAWRREAAALALCGVFWWLTLLNFANNGAYASRPRMGHELAAFVAEVARQEATGDGAVEARLERGIWSLELRRPGHPGGVR